MSLPHGPLVGVRIVEVSSFVAAPLGCMVLAQLGAEVLRIDPLGGGLDSNRWPLAPGGESMYWAGLNKGKKSLRVDIRSERGREILGRLLGDEGDQGGVVVTNVDMPMMRLEALREHRPDVIVVRVQGRHDGTPAVDYTVNAASGFPMITGPSAISAPVNHVLPAWDVACGLYVAVGVLSALRQRDHSGAGSSTEVSLEDVAVSTAGHLGYLAETELGGVRRRRLGNHLYGAFASDFISADESRFMVVALTGRQWADLVEVCGIQPALLALAAALKVDFGEDATRYRFREALAALVQEWFDRHDEHEVEAVLGRTRVLWSKFRSFEELVSQARARPEMLPVLSPIDQPGMGRHLAPGCPIVIDGERIPAAAAPQQGADTRGVLAELLALEDEELAFLETAGVTESR